MMKVLICDDEIQIRKGLRMKIDWNQEGFEIVDEASNGQEAMEKLRQREIDVVITDVRMPIMDGIEFVKRSHQEFPNLKIIVLSGYSDFEYAKATMQAGVKDYLLKPVAPDELVEALQRIRYEMEEQKKKQKESEHMIRQVYNQLEEMREQYLLYLVKEEFNKFDFANDRLKQLKLEELAKENIKVQFVTVEMRGSEVEKGKELWLPFKMLCKEFAEMAEATYAFYDTSYANMIHFIHCIDRDPLTETSSFIRSLQAKINRYLPVETVIGIGEVVIGLHQFKKGYISSLLTWSQSQVGIRSQVMEKGVTNEVFDYTPDFEKRLTNSIEAVDLLSFRALVHEIIEKNQSMMSFSFMANRVLFLLGSLAKKYDIENNEINNKIWNCQQSIWELNSQHRVKEQLDHLAQSIMKTINKVRSSSSGAELVQNVCRFLENHYASEISLSLLSKQFHINSAYLSEIFKAHVGQNFSDYLNNLRMENARLFLGDPQLKIIDVAHLVGFSNSGYFSTVFKKQFGQTPAEYRKTLHTSE
ncbi:response regulator transcription factor [Sutcliffiella deserti]|uniref:response regulator transcription factor n=1 Tax=Sutcliffiella deserti TaxID=2875501 RepID=UPI001CC017E9|nr:response regulator [Sutcliffiella deserti]